MGESEVVNIQESWGPARPTHPSHSCKLTASSFTCVVPSPTFTTVLLSLWGSGVCVCVSMGSCCVPFHFASTCPPLFRHNDLLGRTGQQKRGAGREEQGHHHKASG